jgi:lipoyl-dependent peroxiredoxin
VIGMPIRTADARWEGSLREGKGNMSMGSGAYEGPYSFSSRFEDGTGTNPEELIAAAHAGCFSMALSGALGKAGHDPESVSTTAAVHIEKSDAGFSITRVHLTTQAVVPGIEQAQFEEIANGAKAGCPVSRALAGVEITLDATLA